MKSVGADEAKMHLSRLLDEVAAGETITITRHGSPVAQLVPPGGISQDQVDAAVNAIHEFRERENIRLNGLTIKEMIEEGRM